MSGNEITLPSEVVNTQMVVQRDPEVVLAEAHKAAKALQNVIANKAKKVVFNGEQYMEYEDWTVLARFYGLAVQTKDAAPIEINGVHGARASADVFDIKSGQVVGRADAYCLRDEQNWKGKPWFQLASMAQTRAGAKALRNVLSWVVVLAGYKATPAEEMVIIDTPNDAIEPQVAVAEDTKITELQRKRFFAIWKESGKPEAEIKAYLQQKIGSQHSRDITKALYEEVITWLQTK